ncbi:MAG: NAD kinase, partial [Acetobacteraceae bacterium]
MQRLRIRFTASKAPAAVEAYAGLTATYGQADARRADVIVALGGDGFMLQTLHAAHGHGLPVYGMNCG